MSDVTDPPEYRDPPTVTVPHFFLFRVLDTEARRTESEFGIYGIYTHIEPPDGYTYPVRLKRIYVYLQLSGEEGEYKPSVRLVKIDRDENNEEVEVEVDPIHWTRNRVG